MDSRAAFDAWLADTPFTANVDAIYERFSNKCFALEDCLLALDPENPTFLAFCAACDPITFSVEGSPHTWVPKAFLYDLKRTTAHKVELSKLSLLTYIQTLMWSETWLLLYISPTST